MVGTTVFSGSLPCDLPAFWRRFWVETGFYRDYLALQGDRDVDISPWRQLAPGTLARHIETSHKLKIRVPGTPTHARSHLTQTATVRTTGAGSGAGGGFGNQRSHRFTRIRLHNEPCNEGATVDVTRTPRAQQTWRRTRSSPTPRRACCRCSFR